MQGARLTKKYLFSLETGVYLASNSYHRGEEGKPISVFHGYIPELAAREQVWIKIKEAEANGCLCYVFKDKDAYMEYLKSIAHLY
jgi:hypothetical protein